VFHGAAWKTNSLSSFSDIELLAASEVNVRYSIEKQDEACSDISVHTN